MKDIYDKLQIPPANADFESRIIAAANMQRKRIFISRLSVLAACFVLTISVLIPQQQQVVSPEDILSDVDFFDDQYGFAADIS